MKFCLHSLKNPGEKSEEFILGLEKQLRQSERGWQEIVYN